MFIVVSVRLSTLTTGVIVYTAVGWEGDIVTEKLVYRMLRAGNIIASDVTSRLQSLSY